jgi:hypothetical protein
MEWLTDLLKHLNLSRSVVVAIFVASAAQYIGARYWPTYVEPAPKGWGFAIFMAFVLTGTLLLFWVATAIWDIAARTAKSASQSFGAKSLSHQEAELLVAMAVDPNRPLNVDDIDYERLPLTKLEMLNTLRSLCRKGLVQDNPYASCLYSISDIGQQRALELLKAKEGA